MSASRVTAPSTDRRIVDGTAIVAFVMALVSAVLTDFWLLSTVLAISALCTSLASRRTLRQSPQLRGTTLSLLAFLIAVGVLVVAVGPLVLAVTLYLAAPPG